MAEAVDAVKVNKSVRTVILCSLVPGIFCAGEVLFTVSTMISSLLSSHVHHSRCLVNSSITVRYRIYIFGYGNFSGKVQQYPSLWPTAYCRMPYCGHLTVWFPNKCSTFCTLFCNSLDQVCLWVLCKWQSFYTCHKISTGIKSCCNKGLRDHL